MAGSIIDVRKGDADKVEFIRWHSNDDFDLTKSKGGVEFKDPDVTNDDYMIPDVETARALIKAIEYSIQENWYPEQTGEDSNW